MKAVMFHYVRPMDKSFPRLFRLDIKNFINQLDYFDKKFGFISREDFINSIKNHQTKKGIILTFDDGLVCHYKYVFEELKKRRIWGIFFIPTLPFEESKILDVHRIHILLSRVNSKTIYDFLNKISIDKLFEEDKIEEFKEFTYWNQSNDISTLLVKRILNYFLKYEHRKDVIDVLFETFIKEKISLDQIYLSMENLKEMKSEGMVIGSHTRTHKVLSKLNIASQESEISKSFNFLDNNLGKMDIKTFCYPYGGFHSFNEHTEKILDDHNVDCSFNVEKRDISITDINNRPQALPRYDCNQFKFGKAVND